MTPLFRFQHDVRLGALEDRLEALCGASCIGPYSRISTHCDKAIATTRAERYPGRYRRLDLAIDRLFRIRISTRWVTGSITEQIEGILKPQQEEKLRQLGVKI